MHRADFPRPEASGYLGAHLTKNRGDMQPESSFAVECGRRQLFIDGHGVAASDHLQWRMHQPSKKGAVIRAERGSLQTRSMPAWDSEKEQYKLWVYSEDGDTVYHSKDGVALEFRRRTKRERGSRGARRPGPHALPEI